MEEISDKGLVEACRRGEKQAYATLVRRYSRRVFAICLAIVGDVHEAEDLAQETLLKGFSQIESLCGEEQFVSWIIKIARNLCFDFLRRKKRYRVVLGQQDSGVQVSDNENSNLRQAMERLPVAYRLPLLLYYFEDQSAKKVAETLNITQTAVYNRLSRARKELRTLLAKRGGK